jgi:hypothetical protein
MAMRILRTGVVALSLLNLTVLSGCASRPPAGAPPFVADRYPVIVRLVGRTQVITITSGPNSPLYSIASLQGEPLVSDATLDELRTLDPPTYRMLNPAISPGGSAALGMDASLDASR